MYSEKIKKETQRLINIKFSDDFDVYSLSNKVSNWYELKYPERDFDRDDGIINVDFDGIKSISSEMNVKQLLYRLSDEELSLLNVGYCGNGYHVYHTKGNINESRMDTFIRIYKNDEINNQIYACKPPYFLIYADYLTGKVSKEYELDKYVENTDDLSLEKLLQFFKEYYSDELDYSELQRCISDHNQKVNLRDDVLGFIAIKLLYSKNTRPERGYFRARKFIEEFNNELNTNLSTDRIDSIMDRSGSLKRILQK